jgi:hypothetical protein
VKLGRIIALFVSLLIAASPLLACLPNSGMTPAEMECCKKMAGNCDMGGANHKCCDITVNHSAYTALIAQSTAHHAFVLCAFSDVDETAGLVPQFVEQIRPASILTAYSRPASPTVLRI